MSLCGNAVSIWRWDTSYGKTGDSGNLSVPDPDVSWHAGRQTCSPGPSKLARQQSPEAAVQQSKLRSTNAFFSQEICSDSH